MAVKPGEKKERILHALAEMLENPRGEKITTAALAAKLNVSEAALYRHFASKAQMFEGLIEFIEQTLFGLINKIGTEEASGIRQLHGILTMLLGFAQKNPGMTRVLIGAALVNEDERLQMRINQLLDRVEASLRQSLRIAMTGNEIPESADVNAQANLMLCCVLGRWQQFAKSGFTRPPAEWWEGQWRALLSALR